jgi:DNA-binding NarL/FixJ family response regulator
MEALRVIPTSTAGELIGREQERAEFEAALGAAAAGKGGVLLIVGEAGVGKTRLANEILATSDLELFSGVATQRATPPYGPLIAALRSYLRLEPDGLRECGPLRRHLALLLPELGRPPAESDRATLFEAIRAALAAIAARAPSALLLDDLQWSDDTTLELLAAVAGPLEQEPLLIVGLYRSDEIPRLHPIRRLRSDLRRAGRLHEVSLEPLSPEQTTALIARVVGGAPSRSLAMTIHAATNGVPFFIEELSAALADGGRLQEGMKGIDLVAGAELPIPQTVRDAVLLRTAGLQPEELDALEVASVAGIRFPLELVADLVGEAGLHEALERGFLLEAEPGVAAFRHDLVREALFHSVPWGRRRVLHGEFARRLEAMGGAPATIAEHWLAGKEPEAAWRSLLAASEASLAVHAHRDALHALRLAVDVWPEGEAAQERLEALARLGECAHLCGEFGEAMRAWREAADGCATAGDTRRCAEIHRRLASVYELQCRWDAAYAARDAAARGFVASGLPGEAAAERLAAAGNVQAAGRLSHALELILDAQQRARAAGRTDLEARAVALAGLVRARLGDVGPGLELARNALSLALTGGLTEAAAYAYEKIGMIREHTSDYRGAADAFTTAYDFCQEHGVEGTAYLCLGCLVVILRKTGDWERAEEVCRGVLASADAPRPTRCTAMGELGMIEVLRGQVRRGRALLADSFVQAERTDYLFMKMEATWGLAQADELEQEHDAAVERCRQLLAYARESEDSHYPVPALRWAAGLFGSRGASSEARECAEILARLASLTDNAEALAALAYVLGELALLEGDAEQAAQQFLQALELLRGIDVPVESAETQVRAGVALAAAGEREAAVERLSEAYRIARKLGARPLAKTVAQKLDRLGEPVERRLGRRAAAELERGGLSRRELEVLRLVAQGLTNRQIARDLFLSPRTVDVHVRHILAKLNSRTRTDATRKAGELGLLS